MEPSNEKKYIGPREVIGAQVMEYKTPKGGDVVKVIYANADLAFEIMPLETFKATVSDVPQTWNWLREKRTERLIDALAAECLEHDVTYADIAYLGRELEQKLKIAFNRATNFLWTKDDRQFIAGAESPLFNHSLLEAEQVLKGIPKHEPESEPKQ